MATVIRDAAIGEEPLVLRTSGVVAPLPARPAVAPAPAKPALRAATPAPAPAVDPKQVEREWRSALQTEREHVLQEARDAGYAAGHAEGLQAGEAAWADRIDALDRAIAAVHDGWHGGIEQAEDAIVEIAFEAVSRLLGATAATREGVIALVREAMRSVRERESLTLHLAPADAAVIASVRGELQKSAQLRGLEIAADERVELGGCLIETAGGSLDARLETQLARLRDVLLAVRQANAESAP
jgi:flagellar assembly protein FliH